MKWKPKTFEKFYALDVDVWTVDNPAHTETQVLFRTKKLRSEALKKIKKVLKECKKG